MRFKPHEYQRYCINRMIREPRLGLFLDMGLGKTVITLTALNEMINYQCSVERVLIIAPKRVAETTWTDERDKWDHLRHLRLSRILGSSAERMAAAEEEADIYLINRENVSWLVDNFKKNWKWDAVVIDELSSFKNPSAKRFKKLKQVLPHIKRLYGLTGTPAANGYMDLWAEVYLLDQGKRLHKTITQYRERYFTPDKRNQHTVFSYKLRKGCDRVIQERISDICISLQDRADVPDTVCQTSSLNLSPPVKAAYRKLEEDLVLELKDTEITAFNAGVLVNKLLQIASGSVYDEAGNYHIIHQEKLEVLREVLEQASGNVLVFFNFRHEKEEIMKAFKEARVLGGEEEIRSWNAGRIKLLLAHPASCGYGLNLQSGGHTIVWFSPTWNLEQYEQANARLARQGQKHPVVINHIIANDTVDELVMKALRDKEQIQTALLKELEKYES